MISIVNKLLNILQVMKNKNDLLFESRFFQLKHRVIQKSEIGFFRADITWDEDFVSNDHKIK